MGPHADFPANVRVAEPCSPGCCAADDAPEFTASLRAFLETLALVLRHKAGGPAPGAVVLELRSGEYVQHALVVPGKRSSPPEAVVLQLRVEATEHAEGHPEGHWHLAISREVMPHGAVWPAVETELQWARRLLGVQMAVWQVRLLQLQAWLPFGILRVSLGEELDLHHLRELESDWRAQQQAMRLLAKMQGRAARKQPGGHRGGGNILQHRRKTSASAAGDGAGPGAADGSDADGSEQDQADVESDSAEQEEWALWAAARDEEDRQAPPRVLRARLPRAGEGVLSLSSRKGWQRTFSEDCARAST